MRKNAVAQLLLYAVSAILSPTLFAQSATDDNKGNTNSYHFSQIYPRIANLYGASLDCMNIEDGMPYWKKLGMIIGGGADWHNDYDKKQVSDNADRAALTAVLVRKQNPGIIVLPYIDVIEGPDNPSLPADYWLKDAAGNRVSTWPGFWRVDTSRKEVLDLAANAVKTYVYRTQAWDGVFLDCWAPDAYLVPAVRSLSADRYIVTNKGDLPKTVSPLVNGAMSEDELNLVASGRIRFSDLMERYLRWCRDSAKPSLSIISCFPRTIDPDPWRWAQKTSEERNAILENNKSADLPMMRFGLCFTLMGDGFFAYDGGTQVRGGAHWWYPEYDIPLGKPLGETSMLTADFYKREFENGTVMVNGSAYDEPVTFEKVVKDVSTGRISRSFIIPRTDGRIFVPTGQIENSIPCDPVIFSRSGSDRILTEKSTGGITRWQFPGGLELYFGINGLVSAVGWKGKIILTGGYPNIALKGWIPVEGVPEGVILEPIVPTVQGKAGKTASGSYIWKGSLIWNSDLVKEKKFLRDKYEIKLDIENDGTVRLKIKDSLETLADFPFEMWRHFLFLPIEIWKGKSGNYRSTPEASRKPLLLPDKMVKDVIANGQILELNGAGFRLEIRSSLSFGLVDHRQWGTNDYLWAGYPVPNPVLKDKKVRTELEVVIIPEKAP